MRMHMTMQIDGGPDPQVRVDEMVKVAKIYADTAGVDQGDAVMMLLCAAARIYIDLTLQSADPLPPALLTALINAVACARDMVLTKSQEPQAMH